MRYGIFRVRQVISYLSQLHPVSCTNRRFVKLTLSSTEDHTEVSSFWMSLYVCDGHLRISVVVATCQQATS